jgi:hypothetical protein
LIHSVEVPFERIYVSGPESMERNEPGIDLLKSFRLQPVETPPVAAAAVDTHGAAILLNGRP